jgi:hypothetical protein
MLIAGPLWGNFISRYVELHIPDDVTSRIWARVKCRHSALACR